MSHYCLDLSHRNLNRSSNATVTFKIWYDLLELSADWICWISPWRRQLRFFQHCCCTGKLHDLQSLFSCRRFNAIGSILRSAVRLPWGTAAQISQHHRPRFHSTIDQVLFGVAGRLIRNIWGHFWRVLRTCPAVLTSDRWRRQSSSLHSHLPPPHPQVLKWLSDSMFSS